MADEGSSNASSSIVIDLRLLEEFYKCHLAHSHSFPAATLAQRAYQLPERSTPLLIVYGSEPLGGEEQQAIDYLQKAKWEIASVVSFASIERADREEEEGGSSSSSSKKRRRFESGAPPHGQRCWNPSPFLALAIGSVEERLAGPGVCLDVGCGCGRDMNFLAERGWSVVGFDNRRKLLKQALSLYTTFNVERSGSLAVVDVTVKQALPFRKGSFDFVVVVRFLCRESLALLFEMVRPGGYILYNHFLDGVQHTAVGTPKTSDGFLFRGELKKLAAAHGFTCVCDAEDTLADGRPVCNFLAERACQYSQSSNS